MASAGQHGQAQGDGPLGLDSSTMIAMGGFILGFGSLVLILTWDVPLLTMMCLPTAIIPGTAALAWGFVVRRKEQAVQGLAEFLSTKRRIPMNTIASSIGRNRMDMERLLGKAERRGLISGVVDSSTDEWISQDAIGKQVFVAQCASCGGQVNKWVFPEEFVQCPYCGAGITSVAKPPTTR
jgi:DNA-directed RNA polymerase subunit RPC12/RpoP